MRYSTNLMKKYPSIVIFISGAASALLLALGFNQAAQKLDPVSHKSQTISTIETGEIADMPCMACTGSGGGGSGGGNSGGGGVVKEKRLALHS